MAVGKAAWSLEVLIERGRSFSTKGKDSLGKIFYNGARLPVDQLTDAYLKTSD